MPARGLRFGYITNGFRDHRLEDAFRVLAELGYDGVGITVDAGHLDPLRAGREAVLRVREHLSSFGLEAVVETGGRYVLDPFRKHWPSLVSAERSEVRLEFLRRALEIAEALGARVLSLWSGVEEAGLGREESFERLASSLRALEREARARGVVLGFEPEPGMLVGDLAAYRSLRELLPVGEHPALRMTIDVGHLQCTEEPPHDRWIREFAEDLVNVHLDDVRGREHQHLPLGEGEIDFPPLLRTLEEIGYRGLALIELSRHSHAAPEMADRSLRFLKRIA